MLKTSNQLREWGAEKFINDKKRTNNEYLFIKKVIEENKKLKSQIKEITKVNNGNVMNSVNNIDMNGMILPSLNNNVNPAISMDNPQINIQNVQNIQNIQNSYNDINIYNEDKRKIKSKHGKNLSIAIYKDYKTYTDEVKLKKNSSNTNNKSISLNYSEIVKLIRSDPNSNKLKKNINNVIDILYSKKLTNS